jgi:signal transduction histidine kinase
MLHLDRVIQYFARLREPETAGTPTVEPLAVIRHDMTEPLRSIVTCFELIRSKNGDPSGEAVEMLMTTAEVAAKELLARVSAQLEDVAGLDELSRHGERSELELTCDSGEALSLALTSLTDLVSRTNGTVRHGTLPMVGIGPLDLHLVFQILISNALNYAGRPDPEVVVEATQTEAGMVRFTVTDNGPGIPVAEHEQVFAPFFRGSTAKGFIGSGIGLNTCRDTLERCKGRIWVAKDYENGCRICFETLQTGPSF